MTGAFEGEAGNRPRFAANTGQHLDAEMIPTGVTLPRCEGAHRGKRSRNRSKLLIAQGVLKSDGAALGRSSAPITACSGNILRRCRTPRRSSPGAGAAQPRHIPGIPCPCPHGPSRDLRVPNLVLALLISSAIHVSPAILGRMSRSFGPCGRCRGPSSPASFRRGRSRDLPVPRVRSRRCGAFSNPGPSPDRRLSVVRGRHFDPTAEGVSARPGGSFNLCRSSGLRCVFPAPGPSSPGSRRQAGSRRGRIRAWDFLRWV